MRNPDKLFYDLSYRFADQSKCQTRHVGCVIVSENRVIGQGYNSAPEGSDCGDCPRCMNGKPESGKDLEKAICTHSEANAIGYCARHGISTRNSKLYCTTMPCMECAKLIVAAGIIEVIYDKTYSHIELTKKILYNANIKVRQFNVEAYA